jgi:endonuclease/exonuclease/phosphatase family metal-dependent hydrolase
MPYYPRLKRSNAPKEIKKRTAENILKLKKQLSKDIPEKDLDKHLLLATWNIRDLGKNGAKQGRRTLEDLFYLAEIISKFDLIAVQEVNDLYDWENIMSILGGDWDYIATDISEHSEGGNGERMTFVYDTRKVSFKNIAGEIVLSRANLVSKNVEDGPDDVTDHGRQFARTPFLVSFQAGWFHFDLCTVHIYFGSESGAKLNRRIAEIEQIAEEIKERSDIAFKNHKHAMILLGDFNIVHPEHETMKALKKHKFKIPKKLDKPSNLNEDKYYDQIAIRSKDGDILKFINKEGSGECNAGIFEIFRSVMRPSDWDDYKEEMKTTKQGGKLTTDAEFKKYFKTWKTYHLSDHKPMWVRIPVDRSEAYIKNIMGM